jgi:DNA mismatch endonuclease, patch repair protein
MTMPAARSNQPCNARDSACRKSHSKAPSFRSLTSASRNATRASKAASRKANNAPELALKRSLRRLGLRGYAGKRRLFGRPDIVFLHVKIAVFCDGDFWHGNRWKTRRQKLLRGHNREYWIAKIEYNMRRDRVASRTLASMGWECLRFWESEIRADPGHIAEQIAVAVARRKLDIRTSQQYDGLPPRD